MGNTSWPARNTCMTTGNWFTPYPLSEKLLALSHVWQSKDGDQYVIAARFPEAIAELCHFDARQFSEMEVQIGRMAEEGLRVLGVARALFSHTALPDQQHDFDFEFVGLLGLADPWRAQRAGRHPRVLFRRRASHHDYRGLPRNGQKHCSANRSEAGRSGNNRSRAGRCRTKCWPSASAM